MAFPRAADAADAADAAGPTPAVAILLGRDPDPPLVLPWR
jgi:hypothetical protein